MTGNAFLQLATTVSVGLCGVSLLLTVVRLIKGPTDADRVVALDLTTFLTIAFVGLSALGSGHSALLDIGMVLALSAFIGTLALTHYIEVRARGKDALK